MAKSNALRPCNIQDETHRKYRVVVKFSEMRHATNVKTSNVIGPKGGIARGLNSLLA